MHRKQCGAAAMVVFALCVSTGAAAQVESVVINKNFGYLQTGPSTVALDPAPNNYGFSADVNGSNIAGIPAPTVTGPINTGLVNPTHNNGRLVYSSGDSGWRWGTPNADDFGTSSLANLNAVFGSGTYTMTVNGVAIPLSLTGDAYPNMPILTLSGGTWSGGKYVIDASQPLTVTTNAFTGYGSHVDDLICAGIIGPGFPVPFASVAPFGCAWLTGTFQFHSSTPGPNFVTFTMPAYTLKGGNEYTVGALFTAIVDKHPVAALPGSVNVADYEVRTFATVSVTGATAPPTNGAQVSGTFAGTSPDGGSFQASFTCTSTPICSGTYTLNEKLPECTNNDSHTGNFLMSGLDVSHAGALKGFVTLGSDTHAHVLADGSCTFTVASDTQTFPFDGVWDGTNGTLVLHPTDDNGVHFDVKGTFKSSVSATPVFPLNVTGTVTPTVANVSAQLTFRTQDVGSSGSVYVFALAPANQVKNAPLPKGSQVGLVARFLPEDDPVPCVLAQLNANGQLVGVSASTMQAYVSGVLGAQGASVNILNNVPTPNVAGATFLVGYGPDASTMINNGVNRAAVTVPGAFTCTPQAPQTGWWWNPAEGGRGFSIEVQGNSLFFAIFHYDVSGRSTWNVSPGPVSLGGALFTSDLYQVTGGQTLGGPFKPATAVKAGAITLSFSDASHGTMTWPGGTIPIERQNFIPGSLAAPPLANQPESGWWWNPDESGRGFFIEWQQDRADIAGYMYDDLGNPVWYISVYATPDARTFSGNWWTFANGQSMGGAYKPATFTSDHFAPLSITFTSSTTATMQLPNGRTTNLIRQRF